MSFRTHSVICDRMVNSQRFVAWLDENAEEVQWRLAGESAGRLGGDDQRKGRLD